MADQSYSNSNDGQISIAEIPKFQFEINNDELRSCIKEINFNIKTIEKNISKMKKDVEIRPTESNITEALIIINSGIQIDPSLVKLLKSKEAKKDDTNPIRNSANTLSRKINQIAECLPILMANFKNIEKKVDKVESQITSLVNQKTNAIQEQLNDFKTQQNSQNINMMEKMELSVGQFGNKLREVETKTLWQINDCKTKLQDRVNEQMVRDAVKELQGKMITKIKETVLKGNIDPQRITKIENKLSKNEKEFASSLTQTNFKLAALSQHVQTSLLTKKEQSEQRLDIEKRFSLLNNNFADLYRRTKNLQGTTGENHEAVNQLKQKNEQVNKELNRVNSVLQNLKIGDDFQKMLQKMDPHKICELDNQIQNIQLNELKMSKQFDMLKKQVDQLRSKTQFVGLITPNQERNKGVDKDELATLINEFFVNNQFARKIQLLQAQILQTKSYNDLINGINKRMARLEKESEYQNVIYQLKGLQQFLKKQVLIIGNRMTQLESNFNEERRKRPTSAHMKSASESKLASTVSYKKLVPVNCIGCYPSSSPGFMSSEKKSFVKKFI